MSITGKIKTLFADSAKTEVIFPRTKLSAVTDDNDIGLNVLLDNLRAEIGGSNSNPSPDSGSSSNDTTYPVGAIYLSVDSTSPASLFGGTWEQMKDRFLLGAGGSYAVNATGGEATHTLTINEMPRHSHGISRDDAASSRNADGYIASGSYTYDNTGTTNSTGGGAAHNNMPPYLAVYMWKRIA